MVSCPTSAFWQGRTRGERLRTLGRMKSCSACGTENPDIARFCLACGAQLAEAVLPQETRKVVTIVFSDLKGSTSLGETLDSEALREVMTRYFDAMRAELERHGGVIEKFIGDAVMAVFGLPRLHEDDALRAVRAAAGMQSALEGLNVDLQRRYGVQLSNRTGVNTGEVVAGDPTSGQRLVTGDAVNVAARLEQAAGEREVLLGELTYRLVRHNVEVDEVEPLELKGKAERVPAFRLVEVRQAAVAPAPRESPVVGREAELTRLDQLLAESRSANAGRLVTIVAGAGVGKTRLTQEFDRRLGATALTLEGRCLPYGDGITFWPLAEALKSEAGILDDDSLEEARAKLRAVVGAAGDDVAQRVSAMVGLGEEPFPVEELFWGVRRMLTTRARDRPVVLVVQDIHLAEPTLLELLRQLAVIDDAPLLVVCTARPELEERDPTWGRAEHGAVIELPALDGPASRAMVEGLLGGGTLDPATLDRIVVAADGNPLYAEQLLTMLTDEGLLERRNGEWKPTGEITELHVPPTIQALIAARLDTLSGTERSVIEPASVVGYLFVENAVAALAPPDVATRVPTELTTLVQKHLVQRIDDGDEGAHRFEHIMIRDTAYDGILKRARADLHTRFVDWADNVNRDRAVEFEEILGYHLEQAWRYLSELGPLDDHGLAIGADGSRRLASAGRRAFVRGDLTAAAALLGRAAALLPVDDPGRLRLLPEHGEALLMTGRFDEATAALNEAIEKRRLVPAAAARAALVLLLVRLRTGDPEGWEGPTVEQEITGAIDVFEQVGDNAGLAMAWRLRAWAAGTACRFGDSAQASTRAMEHAQRAGDVRQERRAATAYAGAASLGPTNVDEAIARCESSLERTKGDRQSEGNLLAVLGGLYAMQGSFDHARSLVGQGRALLEELGLDVETARVELEAWHVEMLAGELDAAEEWGRRAYDLLDAVGEKYLLSTVAGSLAQTLLERHAALEEADLLAERARSLATDADVDTQALWRCVKGRVLARRDAYDDAEAIVREGIALLEMTDAVVLQFDAYLDLGEVLSTAGKTDEARAAYEVARELAEGKGGVVALETIGRRLGALDTAR
jgi:class 3 adenylate cyclase/tetratricopeptide (TPR) repeat protein